MDDKSNKLSDNVNVTMHKGSFASKSFSYAKVQRNTAYIGNIISKILKHNRVLDRETLLYAAGLFRDAMLELLQEGKAADVLELGTLYIKPSASMDTLTPKVGDVPEMTLKFTPSVLALQAVKSVKATNAVSQSTAPEIESVYDVATKRAGSPLTAGGVVRVTGRRLKVGGNEGEVGVFFAPAKDGGVYDADTSKWIVVKEADLVDNQNASLLFTLPNGVASGSSYALIVKTAFGNGKRFNKTVRTGAMEGVVTVA